jgi:hypothetical protein
VHPEVLVHDEGATQTWERGFKAVQPPLNNSCSPLFFGLRGPIKAGNQPNRSLPRGILWQIVADIWYILADQGNSRTLQAIVRMGAMNRVTVRKLVAIYKI